jgi:hypothetical protein
MAAGLNAAWAFRVSEAPLFVQGCLGVDYPLNFDSLDYSACVTHRLTEYGHQLPIYALWWTLSEP